MARTDAIVLGAGIVGISAALHLAKRGLCGRAGRPRAAPGEETSYGNAGIIEGNTLFPHAVPVRASARCCGSRSSGRRRRIIICRSCRSSRPGCWPICAASRPERHARDSRGDAAAVCARGRRARGADGARPAPRAICARMAGSSSIAATQAFEALQRELELAAQFGLAAAVARRRGRAGARAVARAGVPPRGASGRRRRASPIRWRSRAPMPRSLPRSAA